MAYCSNCGAKAEGKFCSNCGTVLNKEKSKTDTVATGNILGIDLDSYGESISKIFEMQKEYDQTGVMSDEMVKGLKTGFGLNQVVRQAQENLTKIEKENKEASAQLRKARVDIAKGICPDCGAKFKKRQTSCTKCGASTMVESYEEY